MVGPLAQQHSSSLVVNVWAGVHHSHQCQPRSICQNFQFFHTKICVARESNFLCFLDNEITVTQGDPFRYQINVAVVFLLTPQCFIKS